MNQNRIQDEKPNFTFGSEQFIQANQSKHQDIYKNPYLKSLLQKNKCSQFQNQNFTKINHNKDNSLQTLNSGTNKENQYISLNINERIRTESNHIPNLKPPLNRFRLPRKLSNFSRPSSKEDSNRYKLIAEQLKQMFIQQKYLHEQGQHTKLQNLYKQFEILCKQI